MVHDKHFARQIPALTSTSTATPSVYHGVFINHRGPDVKNTFATDLYKRLLNSQHGLQPFLDKDELQKGQYIHPQIKGAIRTASVHIAIFSPRYAESPWCLDELEHILSKSGDTVIPVFYNVTPSEVRWVSKDAKGQYARALNILEETGRSDPPKVENWREALIQASYIVGFELAKYNGDERKLLEDVVVCVIKNRTKPPMDVATYPTGLHVKVDNFEKTVLSQQQKNGKARVLGIVGMGGAGKTTLVKEFFNMKNSAFNKSCFLFDVRETARLRSLSFLQGKLLKGLTEETDQIDSVNEGIEILRSRLSSVHALIVMDDVDHADQLRALLPIKDVLHSESLILVTSRYMNVLTGSGIAESSIYKLTGLNEQHSQQLFCSHAFLQPQPSPGFEYLVSEFCKACDGLPLSLRVFGALLCGKNDKPYWEGQLDKLRQIKLPSEIQKRLKISYDALEEEEKQIFLDIACYFIGEERDMAIKIWDGSGWSGFVGFRNLQDKCLVEIVEEEKYDLIECKFYGNGFEDKYYDEWTPYKVSSIRMHDHLRDLGREIVDREKSSGVIPYRLWRLTKDIRDLRQQSSLITQVRGIRTVHRLIANIEITRSQDKLSPRWVLPKKSSSKLQLIATEGRDLERILRRAQSPNLIWLRWTNCPDTNLPFWISMENIRVVQVVGEKLKTLWQTASQAPLELRELYIDAPLSKFPNSIGRLKRIEKIVVKNSHIESLPKEFCHLGSLKYLLLRSERLESLPDRFGCLTNLQHLDLSWCERLHGLPDSFGRLSNLQHLDLSKTALDLNEIPDSFCCLAPNLQELHLSCGSLESLPDSFARFTNLQRLQLYAFNSMHELPDSLGSLTNLQDLNLLCSSLYRLPDSFGRLTNIQHLVLGSCIYLQRLPDSFGSLTKLQHLKLSMCQRLQGLPDSFGSLTKLQYLDLTSCSNMNGLPDSFGRLTNLQDLNLSGCWGLQRLPDSFVRLTNLQHLDLSGCSRLQGLPDSFVRLTNLQHLDLEGCSRLQGLPDSNTFFGNFIRLQHFRDCEKHEYRRPL